MQINVKLVKSQHCFGKELLLYNFLDQEFPCAFSLPSVSHLFRPWVNGSCEWPWVVKVCWFEPSRRRWFFRVSFMLVVLGVTLIPSFCLGARIQEKKTQGAGFRNFWRCFYEFDNWCFNSVATRCTVSVGIDKVLKDMAPRYEAAYEDSGLENQQSSAELTCKQCPSNLQPKWLTLGSKTEGTYESRSKLPASNIANC